VTVGAPLGAIDGCSESLGWKDLEGAIEGLRDIVGKTLGMPDGKKEGSEVMVGTIDGASDGTSLGWSDGASLGDEEGSKLGKDEGLSDIDGTVEGMFEGGEEGREVGVEEGWVLGV
jgi:hypothetical protein